MSSCKLVVFDVAGTTVKDAGHVARALSAALAEQGIAATPAQLAAVRGASKRDAIARLLGDGVDAKRRAEAAYATFIEQLTQAYRRHGAVAIDGAEAAFERLREDGVRVALNTGFDRPTTSLLLGALGWTDGIVDAVVCADDVACGRPAPYLIFRAMEWTLVASVHEVAVVGDTALDLQAGHHAGVQWNIGVLTGAHTRQDLERAPHTHLLESVEGVVGVVLGNRF